MEEVKETYLKMADTRLSNSSVTSSAVRLLGAEVTYKWENLVEADPVPSKFDTTSTAQTEVQFMGWNNPKISIRGIVDENDDIPNAINFELLKKFAMATTNTYLFDDIFAPTGSKVAIVNFSIPRVATSKNKKYDYSLELVETL